MFEELKTAEEVIDRLGGPKAVAKITGAKHTSAVSNWKKLGKFPAKAHDVMKHALRERALAAPDDLWNIIHADTEQAS